MYNLLMVIFIYLSQYDIGQIIYDHLSSLDNLCFLFSDSSQLYSMLSNQRKMPDLLILDYLLFNHDLFNIYTELKERKLEFPIIFYNDPCITKSTRAKHWQFVIEITGEKVRQIEDKKFIETLESLQELVESEELSPYIKLMQQPKPLPDYLKKDRLTLDNIKKSKNDSIFEFRNKTNLPKNLFYLLQIFQKNKDLPLTVSDITKIYKSDGKLISEKSIKVLISNLRHYMKKYENCNFFISQNGNLYSFSTLSIKN